MPAPKRLMNAPPLKIDAVLFPNGMDPRNRRERRIVWNMLDHLFKAGFKVMSVFDGDEFTRVDTSKAAMELIFNLDDALVYLSKDNNTQHAVKLVLGNDVDVISDWGYTAGDPDGFNATMELFNAEDYA